MWFRGKVKIKVYKATHSTKYSETITTISEDPIDMIVSPNSLTASWYQQGLQGVSDKATYELYLERNDSLSREDEVEWGGARYKVISDIIPGDLGNLVVVEWLRST